MESTAPSRVEGWMEEGKKGKERRRGLEWRKSETKNEQTKQEEKKKGR